MKKNLTIKHLIRICDTTNQNSPKVGGKRVRDTRTNKRRVTPTHRRIKDSCRKFTKHKVYDSEEAMCFYDTNFDEYPYISEATPLEAFPSILAIQAGTSTILLPTVYPDEQMAIINSADQRRRFEIIGLFKTTGADVREMSGLVCGELIDCDS